jgi:hypothetical protein
VVGVHWCGNPGGRCCGRGHETGPTIDASPLRARPGWRRCPASRDGSLTPSAASSCAGGVPCEPGLRVMAAVVGAQDEVNQRTFRWGQAFDGEAFLAAREHVLEGATHPSGYTEPIMRRHRRAMEAHRERIDT